MKILSHTLFSVGLVTAIALLACEPDESNLRVEDTAGSPSQSRSTGGTDGMAANAQGGFNVSGASMMANEPGAAGSSTAAGEPALSAGSQSSLGGQSSPAQAALPQLGRLRWPEVKSMGSAVRQWWSLSGRRWGNGRGRYGWRRGGWAIEHAVTGRTIHRGRWGAVARRWFACGRCMCCGQWRVWTQCNVS